MVTGHMKAHKAINTTSVPLRTVHMFLYPHGDSSYESQIKLSITTTVPLLTMHMFLYPHGDRSCEST